MGGLNIIRCAYPRCRDDREMSYLGMPVCQRHFEDVDQLILKKIAATYGDTAVQENPPGENERSAHGHSTGTAPE